MVRSLLHREPVDDRHRQGKLLLERRRHADAGPQGSAGAGFALFQANAEVTTAADATACKSNGTNSLVANLDSWFNLSVARSKKWPFVHAAAVVRDTPARRRAAIRSTGEVAAPWSPIRTVHRASAAPSRW